MADRTKIRPYAAPPHALSRVPGAYPPGATRNAPPPRLPSLGGVVPYAPATPPAVQQTQPAVLGEAEKHEAFSLEWDFSDFFSSSVYITRKRWRAIDVYIDPSRLTYASSNGEAFSVLVYAVGQNGRTLVGSGRFGRFPLATNLAIVQPAWVCGARGSAERYEVVLEHTQAGPATAGTLGVTILATDEMVEVPEWVGRVPLSVSGGVEQGTARSGAGAGPMQLLELVGVHGVNNAGGTPAAPVARYLMFFDVGGAAVADGTVPQMVWPLGNLPGDGVNDEKIRYRCRFFPWLRTSSTPDVLTLQTDCIVQGLVR